MTTTIALAGKGGVGKTTVAAMVVKYLVATQDAAILAIDADPSSNFNMVLGLDLEWTVGEIREDMLTQVKSSLGAGGAAMGSLPGGISKRDHLDLEIRSSVAEGTRFDLIAMGRGEGPGCYCAVNHSLREVIDSIGGGYGYVVIDNEAGMEHLSRRTTRDVQHLFVVSDPTQRGIIAAERIASVSHDLDISIDNTYLIVNRLVGEMPEALRARVEQLGFPLLGTIPEMPEMAEFELSGRPLVEMDDSLPVYTATADMLRTVL